MPDDIRTVTDTTAGPMELVTQGQAFHASGHLGRAETAYRQALKLDERCAEALHLLGVVAHQRGHADAAARLIEAALEIEPDQVEMLSNLCSVYRALGKHDEAEAAGRLAATFDPQHVGVRINLANVLLDEGRAVEAQEECRSAMNGDPDNPLAAATSIRALAEMGELEQAERSAAKLITNQPGWSNAHFLAGTVAATAGDRGSAQKHFRRASELAPADMSAWYQLALAGGLNEKDLKDLDLAAIDPTRPTEARALAHFALGEALSDVPDAAFAAFATGNKLDRQHLMESSVRPFDPVDHARTVDELIAGLHVWAPGYDAIEPSNSEAPVFIVGMPRSGTTLVERIVAAHPRGGGVGEHKFVPRLAARLRGGRVVSPSAARDHVAELKARCGSAGRIADKMPFNFRYLELIAALFPNCRIINCARDPRDTALSIFEQHFADPLPWTTNLRDIAVFLASYQRLMGHWREHLPVPVLEISYETLVTESGPEAERLVEFIGLDWHPACLDVPQSGHATHSASKWQVRQPIYTSSVARWRKLETQLTPFVDAFHAAGGKL